MAGDYLRVTVGEDQLVVDCHRFPLCQRLNQQLLFDLRGESTQVISVTATDTVKSEVAHRNTHTRYLQQVRERSQDLWRSHI